LEAITQALNAVTTSGAKGWFSQCGYRLI